MKIEVSYTDGITKQTTMEDFKKELINDGEASGWVDALENLVIENGYASARFFTVRKAVENSLTYGLSFTGGVVKMEVTNDQTKARANAEIDFKTDHVSPPDFFKNHLELMLNYFRNLEDLIK